MLSLVGAVIGLLGSFIPKLLDYFKVKEDHKHELAVLQVQAEMAKSEHRYRMEEINVQADIASEQAVYKQAEPKPTGLRWVDGLLALYSGTIRPTITYLFMGSYIFVKYAQLRVITAAGGDLWGTVWQLWNSEDMAALMTILGFWFGGRLLKSNLATFGVGNNGSGGSPVIKLDNPPTLISKPKPVEKPNKPGAIFSDPSTDNPSGF
jgi:hypothetical protein